MPQMSPLGWVWVVLLVLFGYSMFLVFCYSVMVNKVVLSSFSVCLCSVFWMW